MSKAALIKNAFARAVEIYKDSKIDTLFPVSLESRQAIRSAASSAATRLIGPEEEERVGVKTGFTPLAQKPRWATTVEQEITVLGLNPNEDK